MDRFQLETAWTHLPTPVHISSRGISELRSSYYGVGKTVSRSHRTHRSAQRSADSAASRFYFSVYPALEIPQYNSSTYVLCGGSQSSKLEGRKAVPSDRPGCARIHV
eukprot:3769041-Prymnesium_polylepis.2